jgi:hypothetical protein
MSPAMIFAVPAVLPSLNATLPVPSTWIDAAPALLLFKEIHVARGDVDRCILGGASVEKIRCRKVGGSGDRCGAGRSLVMELYRSSRACDGAKACDGGVAGRGRAPPKGRICEIQVSARVDGDLCIARGRCVVEKEEPIVARPNRESRITYDHRSVTCTTRIVKFDVRIYKSRDCRVISRAVAEELYETACIVSGENLYSPQRRR